MNPHYDYKAFKKWVKTRPKNVQKVALKYIPDSYYYMDGDPERRCTLYSYDVELDGTISLKVDTIPHFLFSHRVFGIKPESLVKGDYIIPT